MTSLWAAIGFIGLVTYATRVVPLFLLRPIGGKRSRSAWLDRLGPCLLAAMATAVIVPTFADADGLSEGLPVAAGLIAAGGSMWLRRDPGVATLVGMIAFFVVSL